MSLSLDNSNALSGFQEQLVSLQEDECQKQVRLLISRGVSLNQIKQTCLLALLEISRLYESGHYFLSGLIMAGRITRKITNLLQPPQEPDIFPGRVQLGSVGRESQGRDKSLFNLVLAAFGFETRDLGQEVTGPAFLASAEMFQPNLVGFFNITPQSLGRLKEIVSGLKALRPDGERPYIFLAGRRTVEPMRRKTGADFSLTSTADILTMCHRLLMNYEPQPN
ncbi:MAG: hypothetical protein LBP22_06190 [Deltaproteobacteria bacterium]|jgi:methanogenic corrinoid protein MtbC1|nr:hypothetical protein [Deltaproteobacteria bacterium]